MKSFRDVIALWGAPSKFAAAIGENPDTVRKWNERDRIPAEHWARTISAARSIGKVVTADELTKLAAKVR